MKREKFILDIERYCERIGIKPTTFGRKCRQGTAFYQRLLDGKRYWPETEASVRQYMKDNPPGRAK